MTQLVLLISAGALAGLLVGAVAGSLFMRQRLRREMAGIGEDIAGIHRLAEEKLLIDEPDLPSLLRNLDAAVAETRAALSGLDRQSELTRAKTQSAQHLTERTRRVLQHLDEMGINAPMVPAEKAVALSQALDRSAETDAPKAPPRLR